MLKYINSYLEGLDWQKCFLLALSIDILLGILDYSLGPQLSFSVFYTAPIMLAGWYSGKKVAMVLVFISAGIWLSADLAAGSQYSNWLIPVWNTMVRLGFFAIILWLLLIVREKLTLEESLADTDPLTGLANRRFFLEQLEREYDRVRRYPEPFTIAYFDLDNFKYINDTMGHDIGDELLYIVAEILTKSVRETDFAARLGGDEFAVLFPAMEKASAPIALEKLQSELLVEMKARAWPVTFSIGAITFSGVMASSRDMVKMVDDLMYEVKKSGKNNFRHMAWPLQIR